MGPDYVAGEVPGKGKISVESIAQLEIDRLKKDLKREQDDGEAARKKLRTALDEQERLKKEVSRLEAVPKLPLPEDQISAFQKKFDALVMHGKTGLSDAFEIAESALKCDSDDHARAVLQRLHERTKHEMSWIRDNGAALVGTVCRAGILFAFSNGQRHKEPGNGR